MEQAIFYKIDWLSVMCQDVSIIDIMDTFVPDTYREDLYQVWADRFICSTTMGSVVQLQYDTMLIQIPQSSIYESFKVFDPETLDPFEFAETAFTKIRVDFSGKCLDMLRSLGLDVESILTGGIVLPRGTCHITRCDHAFDLIDYKPEFLDECISFCNEFHTDSAKPRVSVGSTGGIGYSIRSGDQKTLYLGGGGSDKCLRIYDKKLQYEQSNKFVSECPYGSEDDRPKSWIRVELQCRRGLAQSLIDSVSTSEEIFKYIFNTFGLREPGTRSLKAAPFWLSLFDWSTISVIIQNANSVDYDTIITKCVRRTKTFSYNALIVCMSVFGSDQFVDMLLSQFSELQRSRDPVSQARFNKIIDMCYSYDLPGGYRKPPHLQKNESGVYFIT